jgi:hypothetical protein
VPFFLLDHYRNGVAIRLRDGTAFARFVPRMRSLMHKRLNGSDARRAEELCGSRAKKSGTLGREGWIELRLC